MFGYVSPDAPYLFKKDDVLYTALYCGLCKGISKGCGQIARTALTYDMTFVSALIHNIRGEDVKIERQRCPLNVFKKRPMAKVDDITVAIGCVNTALTYFKLADDKADGDRRGLLKPLYKGGYKRVLKAHPEIIRIISEQTSVQAKLEKEGCKILDMAAEPTALMMQGLSDYLLGAKATDYTRKLFYAIGKWIYLADALDDYDKDVKKGAYNPLYLSYGKSTRAEVTEAFGEELKFVFDMLFSDMREGLANIKFYFNHDLTDNIILRGIPITTRKIFAGEYKVLKRGKNYEQKEL